jgi:hypothetical protein
MNEKLTKMLGDFLERNKEYMVEVYFYDGVTGNMITNKLIVGGFLKEEKERYSIGGNIAEMHGNQIFLPYDEIMDCYEEKDKCIQQSVCVILKNGMKIKFECCGMEM